MTAEKQSALQTIKKKNEIEIPQQVTDDLLGDF